VRKYRYLGLLLVIVLVLFVIGCVKEPSASPSINNPTTTQTPISSPTLSPIYNVTATPTTSSTPILTTSTYNSMQTPTAITTASTTPPTSTTTQISTTTTSKTTSFNPEYTNPVVYQVTRTLTITNTDAQVNLINVWEPSVSAWDSQTNITSIETTPAPTSKWEDADGNGGLYWVFRNNPNKGTPVVIKDEFTYTCYQINYTIDPSKIAAYDKTSDDYQTYTKPIKYVESNDPQIEALAAQLEQGKTNPYIIAGSIYDWVVNHLIYREVNGLQGAKFALENGYGECGDFSALFTALCRADGIPARPVVGRWATSLAQDWHVWAEFYLPGYGWLPVDPTVENLNGKGRVYFGNLDNKRLILHKDFTMVLQPSPIFFSSQAGFLQTFSWEWQGIKGQTPIQADITYTINP
jgi:transglutaminase-like putative cysteine protease